MKKEDNAGAEIRAADVSEQDTYESGMEAYWYTYPLVLMDLTRQQMTNIEAGKMPGRGPMMVFTHRHAFPGANDREVVRPNFDTAPGQEGGLRMQEMWVRSRNEIRNLAKIQNKEVYHES
jgi:hypothetical protein